MKNRYTYPEKQVCVLWLGLPSVTSDKFGQAHFQRHKVQGKENYSSEGTGVKHTRELFPLDS